MWRFPVKTFSEHPVERFQRSSNNSESSQQTAARVVHMTDVSIGFTRVQQRRQWVTRVEEKFTCTQQYGSYVGDKLRCATSRRLHVTISPCKVRQRRLQHSTKYTLTDSRSTICRQVRLEAKHVEIPGLYVHWTPFTLSIYTLSIHKPLNFSTICNKWSEFWWNAHHMGQIFHGVGTM